MSKFLWIKPIYIRSSDEAHRQATWLELFVDLGFVLAISSTTNIFETGFTINSLLVYSGVFSQFFGSGIGLLGMLPFSIITICLLD